MVREIDLHLDELIINLLEIRAKRMLVCIRLVHGTEVYCPHWRCGPKVVDTLRIKALFCFYAGICCEEGFGLPLAKG